MKKLLKVSLLLSLLLVSVNLSTWANDYVDNREWYETTCYDTNLSVKPGNKEKCLGYREYLEAEAKRMEAELKNQQITIAEIRANIVKYANEIQTIEAEIADLQTRIAQSHSKLIVIEANVALLERQIAELTAEIEALEADIHDVMTAMQSAVYFDVFLDFLMASNNFVDLMTKLSIVNDFNDYNKGLIDSRNSKLDLVQEKAVEQWAQRDLAEKNKRKLEVEEQTLATKQTNYKNILTTYREEEAEITRIMTTYKADISSLNKKISEINFGQIISSNAWSRPIKGGYVSAGAFYYPASFGGGIHLGADYTGIGVGGNVLAVANGIVLFSSNACPTTGGYPNSCGAPGAYGGGNQVYLIVSVQNKTYGVTYAHLKKDTVLKAGTTVTSGMKIAEMGSSGNSTGAHVHVEIHYLGTMSIESYARSWNGDFSFGTSWGSAALNKLCVNNGYKAPCRIAPQTILP